MCTNPVTARRSIQPRAQTGISFIELIVFIVVVGIAVAGVVRVFSLTAQKSADPQVRKQMLAAAEALLDEIELKPFTCRDPDDPTASDPSVALSSNTCASGGTPEVSGPEAAFGTQLAAETRNSPSSPFDNVNDYASYSQSPVTDINGTYQLTGYTASVAVVSETLQASVPDPDTLRITVTITRAGGESLSLTGYRLRYAPTAVP